MARQCWQETKKITLVAVINRRSGRLGGLVTAASTSVVAKRACTFDNITMEITAKATLVERHTLLLDLLGRKTLALNSIKPHFSSKLLRFCS